MTIFDLPGLVAEDTLARVHATISAHPLLARIFDDEFVADLVRCARTTEPASAPNTLESYLTELAESGRASAVKRRFYGVGRQF